MVWFLQWVCHRRTTARNHRLNVCCQTRHRIPTASTLRADYINTLPGSKWQIVTCTRHLYTRRMMSFRRPGRNGLDSAGVFIVDSSIRCLIRLACVSVSSIISPRRRLEDDGRVGERFTCCDKPIPRPYYHRGGSFVPSAMLLDQFPSSQYDICQQVTPLPPMGCATADHSDGSDVWPIGFFRITDDNTPYLRPVGGWKISERVKIGEGVYEIRSPPNRLVRCALNCV